MHHLCNPGGSQLLMEAAGTTDHSLLFPSSTKLQPYMSPAHLLLALRTPLLHEAEGGHGGGRGAARQWTAVSAAWTGGHRAGLGEGHTLNPCALQLCTYLSIVLPA